MRNWKEFERNRNKIKPIDAVSKGEYIFYTIQSESLIKKIPTQWKTEHLYEAVQKIQDEFHTILKTFTISDDEYLKVIDVYESMLFEFLN